MLDSLLKKHAKHFVPVDPVILERHKAIEGIHYHENGSIYVTDSHKVLAIHNAHQEESHTVHFKTGKQLDVKYPDVVRLLDMDYRESVVIRMKDVKNYLALIKVASNIDEVGDLILKDGFLKFEVRYFNESFKLLIGETDKEFNVTLNCLYFYYMLNFFKDAKVDEIVFSWNSRVRPLSFRSGDYEIIILPVRRY